MSQVNGNDASDSESPDPSDSKDLAVRERPRRRRQIGSDKRPAPLPAVPRSPGRRQISAARFAIVLTLSAWTAYVVDQVVRLVSGAPSLRGWIETVTYFLVVTALTASALAYLITRLGYLYRTRDHHRVPRATIDDFFSGSMPTLTAIVPSYREDSRIIRQTLLSAALQEYPFMRIVLLIDDPPAPTSAGELELLDQARAVPVEIQALLDGPRRKFEEALSAFEGSTTSSDAEWRARLVELAGLYDDAADWLNEQAGSLEIVDHSDEFLADEVLSRLAGEMTEVASALRGAAEEGIAISERRVLQLYRRLAWTFAADLSSFERKQYVSLSSEPNKAMNLNSYIGLMGRRFRVQETSNGQVLIEVRGEACDLSVPDPDYVLTLDADSILLPEYCLRLVHHMELAGSERLAVTQTPYSAYPGAPTRIERISGATTDLQHIVHQGLTRHDATFWVGANAVLRKSALDDICEVDLEDGLPIRRYIQDRTPIEDTESSIDIRLRGWNLYNYPERLSYSATPPDFGSLCVQRQRWANGGLNMLSKYRQLMRQRRADGCVGAMAEGFLRLNYLASITWASLGLFILLVYPYDDRLVSPVALLTAVPYFVAMSSDLRRCGYRRTDVFRIYGFNLLLLAVNTAGVFKSIEQSIGGQKIAFARTPKVRDRTVAPLSFVVIPYVIVAVSAWTLWRDIQFSHYTHAVFAGSNALLTLYAIVAFVGIRYSLADIRVNLMERLYVKEKAPEVEVEPDWVSVLYYGSAETWKSSQVSTTVAALALVDQQPSEVDNVVEAPHASAELSGGGVPLEGPARRTLRSRLFGRSERRRSDDPSDTHAALVQAFSDFVRESGGDLEVRLDDRVMSLAKPADVVDLRVGTGSAEPASVPADRQNGSGQAEN
jgi:cellulose synthase/poly-beta-1,6-N-acetylglucosamine synthase-like glycosyltransferase